MTTVSALNMIPGKTYRTTSYGPLGIEGIAMTVLSTVSFHPEATFTFTDISLSEREEGSLVQVAYDAWGYPFPESAIFACHDVVVEVPDLPGNTNPALCNDCFYGHTGEWPDMGMGANWFSAACTHCAAEGIVFSWED